MSISLNRPIQGSRQVRIGLSRFQNSYINRCFRNWKPHKYTEAKKKKGSFVCFTNHAHSRIYHRGVLWEYLAELCSTVNKVMNILILWLFPDSHVASRAVWLDFTWSTSALLALRWASERIGTWHDDGGSPESIAAGRWRVSVSSTARNQAQRLRNIWISEAQKLSRDNKRSTAAYKKSNNNEKPTLMFIC